MNQELEQGVNPNGNAYVITVAFGLVEGTAEAFHRLVRENAALSVAREPGCLRFDILTPSGAGHDCDVLLYEIYDNRAAFDAHLLSEHYRTFDEATRAMVAKKTVAVFSLVENAKRGPVEGGLPA